MRKARKLIVLAMVCVMLLGSALTVHAQTKTQYGGRMDITLGNHSTTMMVTAKVDKNTRVEMWDKNWNSVWAGNFSGTRTFDCGSNVYTVTFYLDTNKTATVTW